MINATDGAPYGAALLAGVGTRRYKSVPEACVRAIKVVQRTEPIAENVRRYADLYSSYRGLYPSLSGTFHSLTDFAARG
jgi:xylulokinase